MEDKEEAPKKKGKKQGLWDKVFNKNKLKKGKVAILFLKNNNIAEPMEQEAKKGFFTIKGKNYHEDRDCVYTLGKERYPLCIIPEFSLIPYGTKTWHDKQMLEKFADLQDHTLRGIRAAEMVKMGERDKTKMNTKAVVIIGIVVLIAIAFVMSY